MPVIGMIMIRAGSWTPEGLGVLIGSSFIPSIFFPLVVGTLIDTTLEISSMTTILLLVSLTGVALFIYAVIVDNWNLAILSQIIFGCGASSVTAIQRVLVAYHLEEHLAFSTAMYVGASCLSKFMGKGLMSPLVVSRSRHGVLP